MRGRWRVQVPVTMKSGGCPTSIAIWKVQGPLPLHPLALALALELERSQAPPSRHSNPCELVVTITSGHLTPDTAAVTDFYSLCGVHAVNEVDLGWPEHCLEIQTPRPGDLDTHLFSVDEAECFWVVVRCGHVFHPEAWQMNITTRQTGSSAY